MVVELGLYPLCERCKQTNGGLVSVRHRQVHVRADGRESCVDQGLANLIVRLWTVCDTRSCCEDDDGWAYVVPTAGTIDPAEDLLTDLGLAVERRSGALYFRLPPQRPPAVLPATASAPDA
jgi:hypothetical protein